MAEKKKPAKKAAPAKTTNKPAAKAPAKKPAAEKPAVKAPVKAAAAKKPVAKAPAREATAKKPVAKDPAKEAPAKKPAPAKETAPAEKAKPEAATAKLSGFILKQRQRLLDLRDELVDAMSGMAGEIRNAPEGSEASGSGMHQGDAGSDAYDRDFALSVLAKEQDALYEIEQALRRIDRGVYGVCEMSGEKIPQARLEAIPFARLTVECQAQWEKEYGNRRFRPSNEVGFSNGNYQDDEDSETVSLDEDED